MPRSSLWLNFRKTCDPSLEATPTERSVCFVMYSVYIGLISNMFALHKCRDHEKPDEAAGNSEPGFGVSQNDKDVRNGSNSSEEQEVVPAAECTHDEAANTAAKQENGQEPLMEVMSWLSSLGIKASVEDLMDAN